MAAASCLFVYFVIHLTWDRVGPTDTIDVQGRYFIPVGPLFVVSLSWLAGRLPQLARPATRLLPGLAGCVIPLLLLVSANALYQRFYVDRPADAAERELGEAQQALQKGDNTEAARHLTEAVRLDPGHVRAHFNLGVLLAPTQPREAARHYRAALASDLRNKEARVNLANLLARNAEFPEAIVHYRAVLQVAPDAAIQRNLEQALSAQDKLQRALERIAAVIPACARGIAGKRYSGTDHEGLFLKPNRGEVRNNEGQSPFPTTAFLWRSIPPAGEAIRLFGPAGELLEAPYPRFYACGVDLVGWRRVFVFQPPLKAILLADEDVSWAFQLRMEDLTDREREQEQDFRQSQKLRFPLSLASPAPAAR